MPPKVFGLLRSYQFGWILGVAFEFLVRNSFGDDCANGLEDAIASRDARLQSSEG